MLLPEGNLNERSDPDYGPKPNLGRLSYGIAPESRIALQIVYVFEIV